MFHNSFVFYNCVQFIFIYLVHLKNNNSEINNYDNTVQIIFHVTIYVTIKTKFGYF